MDSAKRKLLAGVLGIAVLAMLAAWLWIRATDRATPVSPPPLPPPASATSQSTNRAIGASAPGGLAEKLRSVSTDLRAAQGAGSARPQLDELRRALSATPTNEAAAAVVQFLRSRADAPTGQGFRINRKGSLDEAPTLRTFLLDYLGGLDPAAAAAYARTILTSPDSPDEWALALRNLARGDASPEGRALLEQKTGELLSHEAWQKDPSAGYLEAFDAAVYLGGTKLVPALTDLVRKQDNPAVSHAAYLALDRLVINDAPAMLGALEAQPELMQGREQTRANYFARADVRDAQQRQVLETYLLDPQIKPGELEQFAGLYPNANYMISANLLTPTPTPDHAALIGRDQEALRVVDGWLGDPRFAKLQSQLQKTKSRLEEFARQANGK